VESEYSNLEDKELFDKLHKAELSDRLLHSPEWKLLKEAADRIIDRTLQRFAFAIKADDMVAIIETQILLRKYKYGLFAEVDQLAQEGELFFEELKERGLLKKEN